MTDGKPFPWTWRWIVACIAACAIGVLCCRWYLCWYYPATTVFVVRHADRDGSNDDLNSLGLARADELVHVLGEVGIEAIYRSNTVRNEKTAEPLAAHLGITPVVYDATDTEQLVSGILADRRGRRVFVVGHSNTVPDIVHRLGGPLLPDINESVYDDLLVVSRCECVRVPQLTYHLKYGAVTPPR